MQSKRRIGIGCFVDPSDTGLFAAFIIHALKFTSVAALPSYVSICFVFMRLPCFPNIAY
jgi:hypothetical protein